MLFSFGVVVNKENINDLGSPAAIIAAAILGPWLCVFYFRKICLLTRYSYILVFLFIEADLLLFFVDGNGFF